MKYVFVIVTVLLFASVRAFYPNGAGDTFAESYFGNEQYQIVSKSIGGQVMYFAFTFVDEENSIFDECIVYFRETDGSYEAVLSIENNDIYDSSGEKLFRGEIRTQTFFGWGIYISERTSSFSLDYYTENGTNVTDGPIFVWNREKRAFEEYVIDESMF